MIPCIIPARGGSKGIPRKNVVPFCGRPLIHWSIESALGSQFVDQVVVATDDSEIAACARTTGYLGVTIFNRSSASAEDNAPSEMVLMELVSSRFADCEAIVFLQATSPLREADDIDNAIELFRASGADSLFSSRKVHGYTWSANGRVLAMRDGPRKPRQTESRCVYEENGSIYVFKPQLLLKTGNRLGGKIVTYVMSPLNSLQIDDQDDLALLETIANARHEHAT